jgi:hypothetical protein
VIREDRFLISRRAYAVDLASMNIKMRGPYPVTGHVRVSVKIRAVWFRRKDKVTAACTGVLWNSQQPAPRTAREFLERFTDGRYGGDCEGRWDGERYWGAQEPDVIVSHLALLRPMLENYPAIPPGFDGWWRF